jgi:hypothetical protein
MTEQPTTSSPRGDGLAADPSVEPGHRARALAASLLGELTGQRRTSSGVGPAPSGGPDADTQAGPQAAGRTSQRSTEDEDGPVERPVAEHVPPVTEPAQEQAPMRAPEPQEQVQERTPEAVREPRTAAPDAPAAPGGLATQARAQGAAPVVATGTAGAGDARPERRPAPFLYAAVAEHHTSPARATANGALDTAGTRISSRVDRDQVRRAAQVALEAASLVDACDVLDARAAAADRTWTGERHSTTEVREFDGAWGAFYDAQAALARHVGA